MKNGNAMRPVSYTIATLISMLLFVFLATPSFGSDAIQHDDEIQQPLTKHPFIMAFSDEQLPHDVRVHILSFLTDQKDLLRMGTVSKSWRKAAEKMWEKRWLDLSRKTLAEADYQAIARGIFPRLTLNKVGLNEEGMNILATGFHLQALELCDNNLRATGSLIKLLSLARLSYIDLYKNSIDAEGAKAIAGVLTQNRTLTTVNLRSNTIGDEGVKAIAGTLSQNTTLTTVDLWSNNISDEGAKAIAGALAQNRTLTTVDLKYNNIGDEGAKAIAGALAQNRTLTTVDLKYNNIGDEGAKAIAEAIEQNTTLTTVDLYGNRIGNKGAKAIAGALAQNRTLTTVNLGSNWIDHKGRKALEDLKRSRPSLTLYY